MTVAITEGEDHMGFDLLSDFLNIYPNLRELDLSGFDYLTGCTPEFEIDLRRARGSEMGSTPEDAMFSLRNLRLQARRTEPHSLRVLFEQTRRMPKLSQLQIAKFTFQSGNNNLEDIPLRLPFVLDLYAFLTGENAVEGRDSCRGWTRPFAASSGGTPPDALSLHLSNRGDLEELHHPGIDLSQLRALSLVATSKPSTMSLTDYGAVVGYCSQLKDMYICAFQRALTEELSPLLSNLTGRLLRTLTIVTFPYDFTTLLFGAADAALAEALDLSQARGLRQLNLAVLDFLGAGLPPGSFPLLAASCRAHHVRFVCVAQDPAGMM